MATLIQKATDVATSITHKTGISTGVTAKPDYSTQNEAKELLVKGIIQNPLMTTLPAELEELSKHVRFEGSPLPSIAINWRFSESIA